MKKEEKEQHFNLAEELRKQKIREKKRRIILKNVREKLEKERTLKLSIKEGSFSSLMTGLGDSYIIPYALALNANNLQIGLLRSFSGLLPPISQIYGAKLMERYSRKKIIVNYVALQAFMWIPIILLSLLVWKGFLILTIPYLLIVFYTLYGIFGSIAGPSWFSLMGDIVPEKIRGKYFGKRNMITGTVALIATLVAAFILDFFKTKGAVLLGFSIIFLIASFGRFVSAYLFKKHYNPRFRLKKKYYFSFLSFIKGYKKYNFTKFSFFVAVIHFSVMIASPFFAVYMLSELNFSYVTFMFINVSYSLATLISYPLWGKFSDKYGRKQVMAFSCILFSIMPALWLFSTSPYYLIFPMLLAGLGWAGFNIASFNFIYDSVSQKRRGLCTAYYSILNGIGIFLGASLGGLILKYIPLLKLTLNSFLVLFLISAFLRLGATLIFLPQIKEVRKVEKFRHIISFRGLKIFPGEAHYITHSIHLTKKQEKEKAKP